MRGGDFYALVLQLSLALQMVGLPSLFLTVPIMAHEVVHCLTNHFLLGGFGISSFGHF